VSPTLLLLAGPSSSGKATALKRALPDLWVFLPADALTAGAPTDRVDLVSLDVDRRLRHGALLALTAFMDAGLNVIGEEYISDHWGRDMARSVLQGRRVFVVKLLCSLAVREEREARRAIHAGFTRKQGLEWNW
jgi:chloramphenicol 3-O-phosphotransferase